MALQSLENHYFCDLSHFLDVQSVQFGTNMTGLPRPSNLLDFTSPRIPLEGLGFLKSPPEMLSLPHRLTSQASWQVPWDQLGGRVELGRLGEGNSFTTLDGWQWDIHGG